MLKKVSVLCSIFFLLALSAQAQWKNVKSTSVTFKIKNAGIGVDGVFKTARVSVYVDEAHPSASGFAGTVDAGSISTGIKLRDTHLKEKEEHFHIAKYPVIEMRSVSVTPKSSGVYAVNWDLTMKGITRRFTTDVMVKASGNVLYLSTEFKIDRNDWNIGGNSMTMGDKVTVKLNSTLTK